MNVVMSHFVYLSPRHCIKVSNLGLLGLLIEKLSVTEQR